MLIISGSITSIVGEVSGSITSILGEVSVRQLVIFLVMELNQSNQI